jgi:predicted RNA-binding Zn-ribbon protein involved in translation (DUF1610 family)
MAEPSHQRPEDRSIASIRCPRCGTQVTAEPAHTGDKGALFECPNCGTLFGIIPGIEEGEAGDQSADGRDPS